MRGSEGRRGENGNFMNFGFRLIAGSVILGVLSSHYLTGQRLFLRSMSVDEDDVA